MTSFGGSDNLARSLAPGMAETCKTELEKLIPFFGDLEVHERRTVAVKISLALVDTLRDQLSDIAADPLDAIYRELALWVHAEGSVYRMAVKRAMEALGGPEHVKSEMDKLRQGPDYALAPKIPTPHPRSQTQSTGSPIYNLPPALHPIGLPDALAAGMGLTESPRCAESVDPDALAQSTGGPIYDPRKPVSDDAVIQDDVSVKLSGTPRTAKLSDAVAGKGFTDPETEDATGLDDDGFDRIADLQVKPPSPPAGVTSLGEDPPSSSSDGVRYVTPFCEPQEGNYP